MDPTGLLEGEPLGRLCDPSLTVCGFRDGIWLSFVFFWSSSLVGEPLAFADSLPEGEACLLCSEPSDNFDFPFCNPPFTSVFATLKRAANAFRDSPGS